VEYPWSTGHWTNIIPPKWDDFWSYNTVYIYIYVLCIGLYNTSCVGYPMFIVIHWCSDILRVLSYSRQGWTFYFHSYISHVCRLMTQCTLSFSRHRWMLCCVDMFTCSGDPSHSWSSLNIFLYLYVDNIWTSSLNFFSISVTVALFPSSIWHCSLPSTVFKSFRLDHQEAWPRVHPYVCHKLDQRQSRVIVVLCRVYLWNDSP
jgi:hypothetical protein